MPSCRLYYTSSGIFVKHFFVGRMSTLDRKKLGKRIKLARIERDLTQAQLAEKINAKQKSISRYETGAAVPSLETFVRITRVLEKPAGFFLDE
jgi:DNA-binding XRE family transcriptional regulator